MLIISPLFSKICFILSTQSCGPFNAAIAAYCVAVLVQENEFIFNQAGKWHYEQNLLGYNYRLSDVHAALGINQLKRLEKIVKKRNELLKFYKSISKNLEISFLDIPEDCLSSVHLAIVRFNNFNPKVHKTIFNNMIFIRTIDL